MARKSSTQEVENLFRFISSPQSYLDQMFSQGLDFQERNDINQFLRDGDFINVLYDQTLKVIHQVKDDCENYDERHDIKSSTLRVFNTAYRICWMITIKRKTFHDVYQTFPMIGFEFSIDLSCCIAWSILTVYNGLYDVDSDDLKIMRTFISNLDFFAEFRELVRMQSEPLFPINFAQPVIVHRPSSASFETDNDSESHFPFPRHGSDNNPNEIPQDSSEKRDLSIDLSSLNEMLDSSFGNIRDSLTVLAEENTRLELDRRVSESNNIKALEAKDAIISQLRSENSLLRRKLKEKETRVKVKKVEVVKEVVKEHPLQKVLNWDTITDYALSLGDSKDVNAIVKMMSRMSARAQCYDDNVDQNIQKIESYIKDLLKPFNKQDFNISGNYIENQNNHQNKPKNHE